MGTFFSQPEQKNSSPAKSEKYLVTSDARPGREEASVVQSAEIIVKSSLQGFVKGFFKEYVIVWHDPNSNSEENQGHKAQLECFCKVFTFTEWEKARNYIKTTQAVCHLLTSGTNGELLVKEIYARENVFHIYVFCENKEYHKKWADNYEKVACVENRIEIIKNHVQKSVGEWLAKEDSFMLDLPTFVPIFNDGDKTQINHLHRFQKVMTNFNNREQAKNDFVNLSKRLFPQKGEISLIENFKQSYNQYDKRQILWWYTRNSFLSRVLNHSLRIATSDSIQYCRLILKDMERAIKEQYQTKSKDLNGLLFRGAYLSEQEWSSLRKNIGQEIEMHGFLSASKEAKYAFNFVKSDPSQNVFITIIVPKGPNEEEQGFAEIEEYSDHPNKKEVLFNVRSRFTVLETEDMHSRELSYRHLVLFYGAQRFRKFIAEKNPIEKISIQNLVSISCTNCKIKALEMPEKLCFVPIANSKNQIYYCKKCLDHDAAPFLCVPITGQTEKIYETEIRGCLLMKANKTETPFYGYKCCYCQAKKQKIYFSCADCSRKEKVWCETCFEKKSSCREAGHNIILENYPFSFWCEKMSKQELNHLKFQNDLVEKSNNIFQQAEAYFASHNFEKAIEFYSLYIEKYKGKGKDFNIATCYHNLASIYVDQGKYNTAHEHYMKSLQIRIRGENNSSVAACYNGLGVIHDRQGKFIKAYEYYSTALKIYKDIQGDNHENIATILNNIGQLYQKQGIYKKALEFFLNSLDIRKSVFGENHPEVATSYNNIGSVYCIQGEYEKAKKSFLKSLEIVKSVYGDNHPDVASSRNNLANVYCNQGKYKMALKSFLKSLDIQKSIYGENHPDVATSLNNIGLVYQNQKEYVKALDYYLKALDIDKSVYGDTHFNVATSYNNVASIYYNQGEFPKALEYFSRSLDITKSVHGDNHSSVATCYNNLASIYGDQGEHEKALTYYSKSLDIRKSVYGEKHPRVAETYNNIANAYDVQGEHTLAINYYLKALDIFKSVHGDDYSQVKIIEDSILELSFPNQSQP